MMKRKMFLISDMTDSFQEFCKHFVEACGAEKARIAFLMQGGKDWKKYFDQYEACFRKSEFDDFFPVFPNKNFSFKSEMLDQLASATGIFVGGGNTFRYIKAYAESPLSDVIRSKYLNGVPYAGLSAGAIISVRLGFLPGFVIKPHFKQKNRFFELISKMQSEKKEIGLGMDDGIWIEIVDDCNFTFHGNGKCYLFRFENDHKFEFEVFKTDMMVIL
ncbi:MAG: Type 1 glutamine amidotransferase-like domain-containing protein [Candidatus Cloacimonetes bacterium]|nr:Type 1 glutamine amidotransferase-like domain-containing protein [Candidatus Cloacimonadota bacterium]MCF7813825.1 Type 1 glutamine amidotransferase-like domain-containing protein [Candidatus Cloacimonadota bacterium]MCF7868263.1 Type 1 glutamine amidotransferase-like domain-containing protein [Candidatus Cloacimonadota bacterium]MCF7883763.1 Type 1 glutamine amidotransferase-like domain-containing protein [Candidatus Cloacimonadota bacterium]